MEQKNDFAKKFKELRLSKYLTQSEMGKIMGVSTATINRWEAGVSAPTLKNIRKFISINTKKEM